MPAIQIMPGAEPYSADGGPLGVLVLHGFTGNPQSMRGLARAFAAQGCTVELPLLPGHGTTVLDMLKTEWDDWSAAAEKAYLELAERVDQVVVAGLSMGGSLALWLASRHDDLAGLVLVNPLAEPPDADTVAFLEALRAEGELIEGIGSDIADPDVVELSYDGTPVGPLLSLMAGVAELAPSLAKIECPVILFTSVQDHVVEPKSSDFVAANVVGPVTRVSLEHSYHVATLDFDAELIEERAVDFVAGL